MKQALAAATLAVAVVVAGCGTENAAQPDDGATMAESAQPDAAVQGAAWLATQLTDGLIHNDQYSLDDYGLTADVGLALLQVSGQEDTVDEIGAALAEQANAYLTGGTEGDLYAGSAAKLAVFAQATGETAEDFGGEDLIGLVGSAVTDTGRAEGRVADQLASGEDYANAIGQAHAVQALSAAGAPEAAPALDFLLRQQCDAGYFRLNFSPAKAPVQGCKDDVDAPDVDATAIAILALQSLDEPSDEAGEAIETGTAWLEGRQRGNGSFGGGTSTKGSNANSTALAASALAEAGACEAAVSAVGWVEKLQVGSSAEGKLAEDGGAVAYNAAAMTQAVADGIVVEAQDQWRRTSAQAVPALLHEDGCS